ncbi:hypothetical protein CLAFUW4_12606 [Fulvia fulva]|nr:uncharacterized protein CLAFUR5_20337 [Fulvia fulva]KAK4617904.1 hypothetical protein CLAFUR4_12611 [Fulvia fulva]KAK4619046.1 hypothetical protein CLAFUR0_12622 [Fulvia fulva]WMI38991.1 hypothetical protein CLAFUR5_20337 [Fulvia fulva]WPV17871.1 hypothetical protein CLAFUW4_12606 [Fulvia fulva]WPV32735.1 hypothetical protein CLAFUW7_12613 [Fulvia fulva]
MSSSTTKRRREGCPGLRHGIRKHVARRRGRWPSITQHPTPSHASQGLV